MADYPGPGKAQEVTMKLELSEKEAAVISLAKGPQCGCRRRCALPIGAKMPPRPEALYCPGIFVPHHLLRSPALFETWDCPENQSRPSPPTWYRYFTLLAMRGTFSIFCRSSMRAVLVSRRHCHRVVFMSLLLYPDTGMFGQLTAPGWVYR